MIITLYHAHNYAGHHTLNPYFQLHGNISIYPVITPCYVQRIPSLQHPSNATGRSHCTTKDPRYPPDRVNLASVEGSTAHACGECTLNNAPNLL